MSVCISLIGLYIAYSVGLFRFKREQEPISAKYQRICQRLSKFGINRPAHLGPNAFAEQLIDTHQQQFPEFCREFDTLTQSYVALKYQQLADGDYQAALKRFNAAAKALNWRLFGPSKQLK